MKILNNKHILDKKCNEFVYKFSLILIYNIEFNVRSIFYKDGQQK